MRGGKLRTRVAHAVQRPAEDSLTELTHIFGILCLISAPVWATLLLFPNSYYGPGTAVLTFPAVIIASALVTSRVAKGNQFLREVMLVGMAIRFVSTAVFLQVYFRVWDGGDLLGYYEHTGDIFHEFYRTGIFTPQLPFARQSLVVDVAGVISIFTGWSLPGLCIIFSFFAFLGEILFFKAFCLSFPKINTRLPAMFFFMLPSLLFWTSFLSKDSIIFLFIGLSFYAFVQMQVTGVRWAPLCVLSLVPITLIRPHIGGMIAIAYMAAFLFTTRKKGYVVLAAKLVLAPLLLAGAVYLVHNAAQFVQADSIDEGVTRLQTLHKGLQTGGSATGSASMSKGLALIPVMAFRPLFWEVHNPQMAVSCIEGCFLFYGFWMRKKGIFLAFRNARNSPALIAATVFCLEFSIIFSIGMGNVGTLVRERAMMLPFWFFIVYSVERAKRQPQSYVAVRRLRAVREMALARNV